MSPVPDRRRTVITLVTAPGCHFCEDAHDVLTRRAGSDDSIELRIVEAMSPEGLSLIGRHRPAMNPLVLVDDEYFSSGRLPGRKLDTHLRRRVGTAGSPRG